MTVNRRFYNSCTRLIYQTVELSFRNLDPYIPDSFQELSRNERRRFVQHIDLLSTGSSKWLDNSAKVQAIRDIPAVIARFPALKSLWVDLGFIIPRAPQPFEVWPPVPPGLNEEEVELPVQPLGGDFQLYPNNIQELCVHRGSDIAHWFPDHARDLARIMPSLRYFQFNGGPPRPNPQGSLVFEALRDAKRLEVLKIQSTAAVSPTCLRHLPRDIPLRCLEICEMILPASDLLAISRFASSLEALEIHTVWITDGTWEEVFNSLCGARRLTLFKGREFGYMPDGSLGPGRNLWRDYPAFERFMQQVYLNRDCLGINIPPQYFSPCILSAWSGTG